MNILNEILANLPIEFIELYGADGKPVVSSLFKLYKHTDGFILAVARVKNQTYMMIKNTLGLFSLTTVTRGPSELTEQLKNKGLTYIETSYFNYEVLSFNF
jgi:hypothetical protein